MRKDLRSFLLRRPGSRARQPWSGLGRLRWPRLRWLRLDWASLRRRRIPWRQLRPHTRRQAGVVAMALLALLWWSSGGPAEANVPSWPRQQILDAIRFVESGDRVDVPDGDGGRAIGPYQIHHVYWRDAIEFAPEIGGTYQNCRRRNYAERVVDAYMRRYVPDAWRLGHAETIARVHNGGPTGMHKTATLGYWQRVRQRLP